MPGCPWQCTRSGAGNRRWPKQCAPHFLFDLAAILPKRLRPQARVVGQPPHERRHLGRRQTGRTRMGYAASVSGKAANGCAAPGPKEKNATAGRSAQSAYLRPPAGDGWPFRVDVLIKRDTLGESLGPGRARIPLCSLSAGAGPAVCQATRWGAALAVNAGRRGRRPLQDVAGNPVNGRPIYHLVGADVHIRPFPAPIYCQGSEQAGLGG